jgi:hypothetical protein
MDSPTAAATQPGPLEFTRRRLSIDADFSHYYIYVGLAGGQRERARERANCGLQGVTVTRSIFRRNSLDSGSVSKAGPRRQPAPASGGGPDNIRRRRPGGASAGPWRRALPRPPESPTAPERARPWRRRRKRRRRAAG